MNNIQERGVLINMEHILQVKGLTKLYGKNKVVDDFSLTVEKGHIYGLIGPNGAGKTTIMKMIAGICMPNTGSIALFGGENHIDEKRSRASFMIEAPYIDGSMTARQNMEYIRYLRGVANKDRIDEILKLVGLANTGVKKAKHFSLGMRQRLGIGMALLSSPELMILDEPVNGLDPEGIVEVRTMLKRLCEENKITILISSHLLSELAELCTDFTIMDRGRLVECISKKELEQKCRNYIAVSANDINELAVVVEHKLGINEYKVMENNEIRIYERLDEIEAISKGITENGLIITKLVVAGESLEEYYLSKVTASGSGEAYQSQRFSLKNLIKRGKQI